MPLFGRHEIARRDHSQRVDPAPVGARHAEFEAVDVGRFAAPRQPAELFHEQARDVSKPSSSDSSDAEILVEFVDAA